MCMMDFGKVDPDFQALQKFVLGKAVTAQKVSIYDTERSLRDGSVSDANKGFSID